MQPCLRSLLGAAPRGLHTPLLGSGNTGPRVDESLGGLSCAFPPVFCLPGIWGPSLAFCSQLLLTTQAKPPPAPREQDQLFSCPSTARLVFCVPDALISPLRQPLRAVPRKELHRVHPSGQGLLLLHRRGETLQGSPGLCFPPCRWRDPPTPGRKQERDPRAGSASGSSFSLQRAGLDGKH